MRPSSAARHAALAGLAAMCLARCAPPAPVGPNVVLVVLDTVRWDGCTWTDRDGEITPHLAALAREGVNYRNAWTPASWTRPAHASLFTSLSPAAHRVGMDEPAFLREDFETIAETLRDAGWDTACFADNPNVSLDLGTAQGFTKFDPVYETEPLPAPRSREVLRRAAKWLEDREDPEKPFFLFANLNDAHLPYQPPAEAQARFVPADADPGDVEAMREFRFTESFGHSLGHEKVPPDRIRLLRALYDAEIAAQDAELGVFLAGLRERGLLDRTVVAVTSDHGEHFEHGLLNHGMGLYAQALHVPLVVRWPGRFDGGRTVEELVLLEDVAPTLLDVCGAPALPEAEGRLLDSPDSPGSERVTRADYGPMTQFVESTLQDFPNADLRLLRIRTFSVCDGRWHLISTSDGDVELYDLAADPEETRDLAPEGGPHLERMRALLVPK